MQVSKLNSETLDTLPQFDRSDIDDYIDDDIDDDDNDTRRCGPSVMSFAGFNNNANSQKQI